MKYIINGTVTFQENDRTISNESESAVLTNTACRLLIILLENNGVLVSRSELLVKIWEELGLRSSESSLNNSVSHLRKSLDQVGIKNALETIPKKGFILNLQSVSIEDIKVDAFSDTSTPCENGNEKRPISYKKLLLILFLPIIVYCGMLLYIKHNSKGGVNRFVGKINNCSVYYHDDDDVSKELFNEFLSEEKKWMESERCDKPAILFYDNNHKKISDGVYSRIVSICTIVNGGVNECENFVDIYHD